MKVREVIVAADRLKRWADRAVMEDCDEGVRYGTVIGLSQAAINYENKRAAYESSNDKEG